MAPYYLPDLSVSEQNSLLGLENPEKGTLGTFITFLHPLQKHLSPLPL